MAANYPKIKVVIRYLAVFEKWFICHEKSYQNAFRSDYNGFETREKAVQFAEENGTEVVFHEHDSLQKQLTNKETDMPKQFETFNIIIETPDGGKITMRDIQRKQTSIFDDAIQALQTFKAKSLDEEKRRIHPPADEVDPH